MLHPSHRQFPHLAFHEAVRLSSQYAFVIPHLNGVELAIN